ncbi:MAG: lysophospholipid acyltransferase family protein [Planctomycetia bacterium]|nr:lysophospholipid acyltransferase family protein [Planctomycetia bacterium]
MSSHQRSLPKRIWYDSLRVLCRIVFLVVYRIRCEGREHIPREGGALVLANHQSHLDPIIVGLGCDRRMNYLARETLFRFPPFRWLIHSLDAIPIDREGLGLNGLKETLRRIKRGELVVMFPEGTRTPDGEVHALKPGFSALARRLNVPLVPVGVDGAFDAWPRTRMFPRFGRIHVEYGAPILPEEILQFEDRELVAEVERRIRACHARARQQLRRMNGHRLDLVRVPE